MDLDLTDHREKGQMLTGGLGFRRVAHWSLTVARFWRAATEME
jgi:hypothetical protein